MDLIKPGKDSVNRYRGKCTDGCGAVWEADKGEIMKMDYDPDLKITYGTDKCAQCGEYFNLYLKGSKEDVT